MLFHLSMGKRHICLRYKPRYAGCHISNIIHSVIDIMKKGFVDIVIGTHRVLSKDVIYKDLGLLIIDEEQRFG